MKKTTKLTKWQLNAINNAFSKTVAPAYHTEVTLKLKYGKRQTGKTNKPK